MPKTISIHTPRMGSDDTALKQAQTANTFQSTLPAWGATFALYPEDYDIYISIHAPRMGSD